MDLMLTRRTGILPFIVGLAPALFACSSEDSDGGKSNGGGSHTTWSFYGGDLGNTRASPDTTISAANVGSLQVKWEIPLSRCTANPAVVDGVVYTGDWSGKLFALKLSDGSELWQTRLGAFPLDASPLVMDGRVYVGDGGGTLYAVNQASGAVEWSVELDAHSSAHLFSSPVAVDGLILIGVASTEVVTFGPEYTFRGSIVGVDAASGTIKWKTYVTDDNPATSGAGCSVWSSFAVDRTRKLGFIGVGQNYELPASQYGDALLAVRYETGEIVWSRQYKAGDVFTSGHAGPDFDIGTTPNLFTIDGRDLVGVGNKGGDFAVFDRETGNEIWQPAFKHVSNGSAQGGFMDSAAYHNGVLYMASNDKIGALDVPQPGNEHVILAVDAATGNTIWEQRKPMPSVGGVTWANGLVYNISTDGTVYALNDQTGEELWQYKMGDIAASGPTIAEGMLLTCHGWAFFKTITSGAKVTGGLIAYGLP